MLSHELALGSGDPEELGNNMDRNVPQSQRSLTKD